MKKIYIKLLQLTLTPLGHLVLSIMLIIICRIVLFKIYIECEPVITIEYVKLEEPYTPRNDYTQMDPMYKTVEEQLEQKIGNKRIVWHKDGTITLEFLKEGRLTKSELKSPQEAHDLMAKLKKELPPIKPNRLIPMKPNALSSKPVSQENLGVASSSKISAKISPVLPSITPQEILKKFNYEQFYSNFVIGLDNLETQEEATKYMISYFKKNLPSVLLSKNVEEMQDNNTPINQLMTIMEHKLNLNTIPKRILHANFQAALCSYNVGHFEHLLDNYKVMTDTYFGMYEKLSESYT